MLDVAEKPASPILHARPPPRRTTDRRAYNGDKLQRQPANMATAAAGRTPAVNAANSFGQAQFRLTQFVGANNAHVPLHPNATIDSEQAPLLMRAQPRPPSGQNPTLPPSRTMTMDPHQSNASPSLGSLELVELAANPLMEGILGPNKDGRVRNPVPSKLKGKTDNNLGNFGVMHMGITAGKKTESHGQGKDAAAERDAAARRTSENTASRAKAAQSEKYVPPKKRGLDSSLNADQRNASPFPISRDGQRSRPLAPDETKSEQARLLTLLRSINPVTVVDQMCKAVAYFGGIPGAPPPEDGIFPESANTRETGALFIGWLAEIFPDLSPKSPEVTKEQGAGKKKGRLSKATKDTLFADSAGSIEAPNPRNGYGYGPAVSAPTWGLPQSLALVNTPDAPAPIPLLESKYQPPQEQQSEQQVSTIPIKPSAEDSASTSKRRRGRPKGSRNKGRADGQPEGSANNELGADGQPAVDSPNAQSSTAKAILPNATTATVNANISPYAANTIIASTASNLLQDNQYPAQSWPGNSQLGQMAHAPNLAPVDEISPEERAVLEAFRPHGSHGVVQQAVPSPIVPTKAPEAGQKRKRAPPKPKAVSTPALQFSNETGTPQLSNTAILPPNSDLSMGMGKDGAQWPSVNTTTTPKAPPPKRVRVRKPKAPVSNDPIARHHPAPVADSATPPMPPSTIPDSQATPSQQSIPISKPPAEGLEAHYERFASFQQQQNGRSHTPTIQPQQQQQQQQARQQTKAQSVTPQQSTPQLQQQQLMQHQKSQQGTQQNLQRDDQKITQASSVRPASTGYFNQASPAATSYSQQYPSHQPSQLYSGHQASPQMSNSTNNSYRTSSTHTLAQASPQFTQAENTYRTTSPHTIPQSTSAYAQPTTNYRNTSTHQLAQQSPAFTQAENSYRTPSSHAMTQPSSAYPTSHGRSQSQSQSSQPSHQSHYNHFSDSSYIDLPTLESLGHSGSSGNTSVGLGAGGYGQGLGVGLNPSRSSTSSNSLYGSTSGLGNAYGNNNNDLLRAVSRSASQSSTAYAGASSGLGNAFDPTSEQDLRDHMFRGSLGRR